MRTTQLPAPAPATMSCDRGMQRFRMDGVEVNHWQGARACGVVAIATEGTGSQDVIKHMEDGLLIGTMSGMTLKDALTYLVKNKDFMNSARSKSLLKNFKLFDMEKNYLEILKVIRKFSIG